MVKKTKIILLLSSILGFASVLSLGFVWNKKPQIKFENQTPQKKKKTDYILKNSSLKIPKDDFVKEKIVPIKLQNNEENAEVVKNKKIIVQTTENYFLKNKANQEKTNLLSASDFTIVFDNLKSVEGSDSLEFLVADQNVNKFFSVKPLTEKAKKYSYTLQVIKNSGFDNQDLQNFTLSWKVFVYDDPQSEPVQVIKIQNESYSQKVTVNQVFDVNTIFSNAKNTNFNQYYNPSIWYVGNNTWFARADANKKIGGDNNNIYDIVNSSVSQVESWSYDGGKSWSNPELFLKMTPNEGKKPSVAQGIAVYDPKVNKLIFVANFWGGNLGPWNKGDSEYGLTDDGLLRLWKINAFSIVNTRPTPSLGPGSRALILVDDSEFDNGTLYYQVFKRKVERNKFQVAQVKEIYENDQKNEEISALNSLYETTDSGWVELKYDQTSKEFSSKVVMQDASTASLQIAKTKFNSVTKKILDGSNSSGNPNNFANYKPTFVSLSGPLVFTFEKDLNDPIGSRKWKLISKYPENYNFAKKDANGQVITNKNKRNGYIEFNPGNGVVFNDGTYGVLYNHDNFGRAYNGNSPALVTGKYDAAKNKVLWRYQSQIREDSENKLYYSQIANGSDIEGNKFAFLPSFSGADNSLIFYTSNNLNEQGNVTLDSSAVPNLDQDNKNSLNFPINLKDFRPGFAGFQSVQGNAWFIVAGPTVKQGNYYDKNGIILLANKDFSRVYPLAKIPGGFQNSVINVEKTEGVNQGLTRIKFAIVYEKKDAGRTEVSFKKFDFNLDLRKE